MIAEVLMGRIVRLVLALQTMRNLRGQPAQSLACRIDQEPVAAGLFRLRKDGIHENTQLFQVVNERRESVQNGGLRCQPRAPKRRLYYSVRMETRSFGLIDRVFGEIDRAIKVLSTPARASREAPAAAEGEMLRDADRALSVRLMRVNHSGEVAAQALYRGQALTSRDAAVSAAMQHAAAEETDHLAWCEQRLRELKGRTSVLNPLWYAGSFAIGA